MDIKALEQGVQGVYLGVAASVVSSYDAIILLGEDIDLVWRQKWTFGTLLFLCNRVGITIQTWVNLIPWFFKTLDRGNCHRLILFEIWVAPLQLINIHAILLMRVIMMYNHRVLTICLVTLYILCSSAPLLVVGMMLNGAQMSGPLPGIPCGIILVDISYYWTSWLAPIIIETTLFALTAAKTFRGAFRGKREAPLMVLLFRDSVLYYAIVFLFLVINILTFTLGSQYTREWFASPAVCLSSVMCSRLFLNLRRARIAHNEGKDKSAEAVALPSTDVEMSPPDSWTSIDRRRM